jgi:hypothetical protein
LRDPSVVVQITKACVLVAVGLILSRCHFLRMARAPLREKVALSATTSVTDSENVTTSPASLINTMATNSIKLLTGNSYPELARLVADR